jgi:hypothetical protein
VAGGGSTSTSTGAAGGATMRAMDDPPPPASGSNLVGPSTQAAPPKEGSFDAALHQAFNPPWFLDPLIGFKTTGRMLYNTAVEVRRETTVIWANTSEMGLPGRVYVTGGTVFAGLTGVRNFSDAGATDTAVDARPQGPGERVLKGGLCLVQLPLAALPIAGVGTKLLGLESKAASTALRAETRAAARTAATDGAPLGEAAAEGLASKGLIGQIGYGSSDLSHVAQAYRQAAGVTGGRNVAVFEYRAADGSLQTIARASERGVGHAERIIGRELESMGVQPSQVTRIYSELQPCNVPGGYCDPFISRTFPEAEVTWSFQYGATVESRAAGVEALRSAVENLGP